MVLAGHEHARASVAAWLEAKVPAYLAWHLEQLGESTPAAPKAYLLDDELPDDKNLYPCILVRSTTAEEDRVVATDPTTVVDFVYKVEVVVAAQRSEFSRKTSNTSPSALSSVDRDRLSYAVRLALRAPGSFDDVTELASPIREDNGAASQMLDGKPVAAGVLSFSVVVTEEIPDLDPAPLISSVDLSVDANLP